MNRRRGFSLVELLVVVSVISLLMSLMTPALRRIRQRARLLACSSNLRQWGMLLQSHSDENDGHLFRGINTQGFWWIDELDRQLQDWKSNQLWFCPNARTPLFDADGDGVAPGQWNVFSAWGVFYNHQTQAPTNLGPNGICGSYGLNGYFLRIPLRAKFQSGVPARAGYRTLTSVRQAYRVPLFIDALRFDLWPDYRDPPAYHEFESWTSRTHMARCSINRHDGYVAAVFADGSCRRVGVKEVWTLKWHRNFRTNGPWTLAGGMRPTEWPEWMRRYRDY